VCIVSIDDIGVRQKADRLTSSWIGMKALSYPSSRNAFSLFTASPGFAAAAGPGWQISIGGTAERRSAKVERIGLVDREARREGDLASSIGRFDMSEGVDPATEALSSSISEAASDCLMQKYSSCLFGRYARFCTRAK
jgi:hypothetical protein